MGIWAEIRNRWRNSAANPTDLILRAFGMGYENSTGIEINADVAMTYSAVYAAVRNISDDIAKMSLHLYERLPRGRERATGHPLYPMLHDAANPSMTSYAFRSTLTSHALIYGNGFAQKIVNGAGRLVQLYPLRPDKMRVTVNEQGEIEYHYQMPDGERLMTRKQVFHLPGFGFDGVRGYSVVALARETMGLGLAMERYGGRFFGNDARPGGYLTHPGKLTPEGARRLKQSWEDQHRGVDKSHKIAVLEEGMSWKEVGIPPEDAQFLESRKFQLSEIARWFRMPLHKLQEMDKATFSNIEHQSLEYVMDTLLTWCVIWEQNISLQLLSERERASYFAKHNLNSLLRADFKTRMEGYNTARQGGWMSANEIRELEEMNPLPPDIGDVVLVNGNMIPVQTAGQRATEPPPPNGGDRVAE